jgi:hypothetical protein
MPKNSEARSLKTFSFNNILPFELEGISHYYTNNKHNNLPSWALDYYYNEGISKNIDNN